MAYGMLRQGPRAIGTLEYNLIRKDGTSIPVEVHIALLRDAQGKTSGFVGINRDISERRYAQRKLEAWARWQAVVATLGQRALSGIEPDALIHETVNMVADSLGTEYCGFLGLMPEGDRLILRDGVGWKDGMIGSVVVEAGKNSQAGYTLLQAEPVVVEDLPGESRFTPAAFLIEHNVLAGMTVLINSKEQPYGILGAYTSHQRHFTPEEISLLQSIANVLAMAIDNRRMLEAEARARQNAEQDNERRLRALAMVSHELRTPLTSIKGFASTLLADDVVWDARQQSDFIRTIDEEADKLASLIAQMLDFSKIEAGVFVLLPARQSPHSLVAAAMPHLQELAAGHKLVIRVPETLPDVVADTQRVGQVLENLVENAAKYSSLETPIRISARLHEKFIEVSVADGGPGIPVQERENIFQPFYRTSNTAILKAKGAGLGLTICKGIIEAQGGRIWVAENPDPGALVSFTLPLADPAERNRVIDDRFKILIIEDEANIRKLISVNLSARGYDVIEAEDCPTGVGDAA